MGWTFIPGESKQQVVKDCLQDWEHNGCSDKCLRHRCVGNELWAVREQTKDGKAERYIALYLLSKCQGDWGYKPMDESCGPYYYKCPKSYLDMVPPANEGWRKEVKAYWKKQDAYRSLRPGMTVRLRDHYQINGEHIPTLTVSHKQRGWIGVRDGQYYRIRAMDIIV